MPPSLTEARLLAARVGPVAQIEAIVLREIQWKAYELAFDPSVPVDVMPDYKLAHGRKDAIVRYKVNSKLTGRVAAGEVFRLESIHEAFFRIDESQILSDDEVEAFGAVSVFFMVFPYVRQLLHELTGNAGLPAILLKPFLLPIDRDPAADQPAISSAESSDGVE
jgi:preprotein translocase subunit SecB